MIHDLTYRIPGAVAFNDWANEKERQWRRRRNGPLVEALRSAGLNDHVSAAAPADLGDTAAAAAEGEG